jgi:RNA polymerase sigma-70 factor (ECF subfamily)
VSQRESLCYPQDSTDAELIALFQAGQRSAMAILYDRYASLVYRLALRILLHPQEAEDLTQDIFLTLWRSNSYQSDRGGLSSYLILLTRSRAIDRLRSRRSHLNLLQRWSGVMSSEPLPITPFELATLEQRSDSVRHALAELPPNQRQVLEMAYYDGLSQSEIAERLETPLGTVKTWSRKGLLNLRQHLKHLL